MNYATNFAIVENGVVTNTIWGMIYGCVRQVESA